MNFESLLTPHLVLRPSTAETYNWLFASQSDAAIMEYLDLKTADDLEVEREKYKLGLVTHNRKFVLFHILEKNTLCHVGAWRCIAGFLRTSGPKWAITSPNPQI